MKNTISTLVIYIVFSLTMMAQDWTVIPYENISENDLRIISLYEDTDGNIWGGNGYAGRVIRWDGENWETFNSSETGMNDNSPFVGDILQDSNGKMWFCSSDGIATWENGNWLNYKTSNSEIPENFVTGIVEEDGKMWFTMRKKLVSFDGSNWTSVEIPDAQYNAGDLASMGNGSFFVTMLNGDPVRRFDGTNWEIFSKDNSDINSDYQYYVEKFDNQTFWFGGPNGRANLYENGSWTPSADIAGWSLGLSEYITGIAINGSKDDVWFSNGDGLFHLKDGIGTEYNTSNSPITSSEVHTVMIASDGKVWCATENEILIYNDGTTNSSEEITSEISLKINSNPVREIIDLTIGVNNHDLSDRANIAIYSSNGQLISTHTTTNTHMKINVNDLTKGIYFMEYSDGINRAVIQFIKQ